MQTHPSGSSNSGEHAALFQASRRELLPPGSCSYFTSAKIVDGPDEKWNPKSMPTVSKEKELVYPGFMMKANFRFLLAFVLRVYLFG